MRNSTVQATQKVNLNESGSWLPRENFAPGNGRVRFEGKWQLDPITIKFEHVSGPDLHLDNLLVEPEYTYAAEVEFRVPADGPVGLAQTQAARNNSGPTLTAVKFKFGSYRSQTDAGISFGVEI